MVSLIALALVLLAVFQTHWFKNYTAKKATSYLSKELGTTVSIGEITLDYFDRLTATDVYLGDQRNDTLIYVKKLEANYDIFSFTDKEITLNGVVLENGFVQVGIPKEETSLNLNFLIQYFTPPKSSNTPSSPAIILEKATLVNTRFRYYNENLEKPIARQFNENDMRFSAINGHLHNFQIINDSLNFVIDDFSGKESSGLEIVNLSASSIISSSTMEFSDLQLETPLSFLGYYLRFDYKSYADFSEFIDVVDISTRLTSSKIHTNDLALFNTNLSRYKELISASGSITGTISNLKSDALNLSIGGHTKFSGEATIKGIPNITSMYVTVQAKRLTSNTTDLAKIIGLSTSPEEFINLGNISYTGKFEGTINDFKVDADLRTNAGTVRSELSFTQGPNSIPTYTGSFSSDSFAVDHILKDLNMGATSFDLNIEGEGLTLETLMTKISGTIPSLEYNGYNYQNLAVNGNISDKIFNGNFGLSDPNYDLDFLGKLNLKSEKPSLTAHTKINKLNLKSLGLDTVDSYVMFNGDINLKGLDLDDIEGEVILDSFELNKAGSQYKLKNVKLNSEIRSNDREFNLASDLINGRINGDFLPSELGLIVDYIKHSIYPTQYEKPIDSLNTNEIYIQADIGKYNPLYAAFFGNIFFDSANASLAYNHRTGKIQGKSELSRLKYNVVGTPFVELNLKNGGNLTPINFGINTGGLYQNDSILFDKLNMNGFIKNGIVNFETTSRRDTIVNIELGGYLTYRNDSIEVFLENSTVEIYNKPWQLKKADFANVVYTNDVTEFRYFFFQNAEEILFLDASLGTNANKVNATLIDFKLENLSPFLAGFDLQLNGLTNGYVDISDREGFPIIEADLNIENLQLDKDTLGTLNLLSTNKSGLLAVAIDGEVVGGLLNEMKILGDIDFKNQKSPLNLTFTSDKSNIKPFEKYLTGLASEVSGYSTSEVRITGPLSSPKLKGEMQLDSLAFMVDYLRTIYTGNANVEIDYNSFKLKSATLYDKLGSEGTVKGGVYHKNFQDFEFDIAISELNNFEIMNTSREDNELFFGTAFVDGNMTVTGPLDDILLRIYAKSRTGTKISIPLDNAETSSKLSYVEFVNFKEDTSIKEAMINSISGVKMDFNFEITNDAEISLIFDELLGDKIDAAGHGNLRMEINTFGDFSMYGGLTVDRGSYLFTALNLINKYFTIEPGGTLFWDGDPYNAKIDLEAIKREYSAPAPLMRGLASESDLDQYQDNIPVDCYLQLEGLLFEPEVAFDLKFPNQTSLSGSASSNLTAAIERVKLDEEELNRQVFALLVLGSFVAPTFATGTSSAGLNQGAAVAGINSLSDFASSQLNNWLSQLDTRWQVGIDYQQSGLLDQNTTENNTELILSLRRKWLNDRLTFESAIDAASQTGFRPYDLSLQYDMNVDGSLKVRGFQKQATDPTLGNLTNVNTTGVGLFYRYQFDKFRLRKKKVKPTKN